jgi:hypothetical protein
MRWPIARNRGSAPTSSTESVPALLQAGAAAVGLLLPVIAVIFYLAVSMIYLIEPFREVDIRAPRAAPPGKP